jgi:DNA-directed RNA polymerase subunit K/omega
MGLKDSKAPQSTITYDREKIEEKVGSIYEAIVILGKRSEQINAELKTELEGKLDEFAVHNASLEEIFENREQIEISKHYEKLPKPTAMALEELLQDEIYIKKQVDNDNF